MRKLYMLLILAMIYAGLGAQNPIEVTSELGIAFAGHNDLRIPRSADNLSLNKELKMNPRMDTRLAISGHIHPKHKLGFLIVPKNFYFKGRLSESILIDGNSISAGTHLKGNYRFSSYRPSYRYVIGKDALWIKSVGAAVNLSDCRVSIDNGDGKINRRTFALVPLLGLDIAIPIMEELSIVLEGEGTIPQLGKANDLYMGLEMLINHDLRLRAGYRYSALECDASKMYSSASFHGASIGFNINIR